MSLLNVVLLAVLCASAIATVADIRRCDDHSEDVCHVSEVRITPCRDPSKCKLKKSSTTSISIDFTPNFNAQNLKTMVFGLIANSYQPFTGFGSNNACLYTSCPTVSGNAQTLNYNLYIDRTLPRGSYLLKWNIWDGDNEQQKCCFHVNIQL